MSSTGKFILAKCGLFSKQLLLVFVFMTSNCCGPPLVHVPCKRQNNKKIPHRQKGAKIQQDCHSNSGWKLIHTLLSWYKHLNKQNWRARVVLWAESSFLSYWNEPHQKTGDEPFKKNQFRYVFGVKYLFLKSKLTHAWIINITWN